MNRVQRTSGPPCLDAQASARIDTGGAGEVERIVGSIGLKVFSHRKRMGLSLQQLGERSDVSAAAIHKIEQGGMVPTITTLLKLASALGRPVSYFVEEDVGQDDVAVLTPPDENRPVYTSHQGIELNSISGPYGRFLLAGARACVDPGASSGRKPMQHPGLEAAVVARATGSYAGSYSSMIRVTRSICTRESLVGAPPTSVGRERGGSGRRRSRCRRRRPAGSPCRSCLRRARRGRLPPH